VGRATKVLARAISSANACTRNFASF